MFPKEIFLKRILLDNTFRRREKKSSPGKAVSTSAWTEKVLVGVGIFKDPKLVTFV